MDRGEPTSFSGQSDSEATMPDDFSLLPNEIIYDVIDAVGVMQASGSNLSKIDGSWGDFGRELSAYTVQRYGLNYDHIFGMILSPNYYERARGENELRISFEEALNQFICNSTIKEEFELDQLTAAAPRLYDVITFRKVPDTYCKALDLMGTRFTNIFWCGNDPQEPATHELVTFLRRQMRSNYLRQLTVFDVKFEDGAFDDQMEVFVKRPSFEFLFMGAGSYPISFQIFKEAYKTWLAPKAFDFENRALNAYSSRDTVEKVEDYFETKFEFNDGASIPFTMRHPEHSTAQMCLSIVEGADLYRIFMHFWEL